MNNRFQQRPLPGMTMADYAALHAAQLAYQQEQVRTEQERQRKLRDEQLNSQNRDNREAAMHQYRLAAEQERARKDDEYKRKQFEYQENRANMQNLADLAKAFGQVWYWEEQVLANKIDIAAKHQENWAKIRLQQLNDAWMQEIALIKALEVERHNHRMEQQDLWSKIWKAREDARSHHAAEHREWCYRNAQLVESSRHNLRMESLEVGKLAETVRRNDIRSEQDYLQYMESVRMGEARIRNDMMRNIVQYDHYEQQRQIQQLNTTTKRSGGFGLRSCLGMIALGFGSIIAAIVLFSFFVFLNAGGGKTATAQAYNNSCLVTVLIFLGIGVLMLILKIRNGIKTRNEEKQRQAFRQKMLDALTPQQQSQMAPPPWQMQHGQQPVPQWVWNQQGPSAGMPPFPPTQQP
jgi:hypothetical protein